MWHYYKKLFEVTDEPGHTFVAAGFMDAFTCLESFVLDRASIPVQWAGQEEEIVFLSMQSEYLRLYSTCSASLTY